MNTELVLFPEEEDKSCGSVVPLVASNGKTYYGLSVGYWLVDDTDNYIHILLREDIDTIVHETATSKAVRAELRAAERDTKGEEKKPTIEYDPITKRFNKVYQ